MIPAWLLDIFAAIMLLVAAVSAARLAAGRPPARPDTDVDAAHVLMGIAMAGMLAAGLHTLPDSAWVVVFAILAAWFGWRVFAESRDRPARELVSGHHVPHLVHSAAMVYMFAAVTTASSSAGGGMAGMTGGSMSGMGTLRVPTIALAFVVIMIGWVVVDLDRISHRDHGADGAPARPAVPRRRRAVAMAVAGGAGPAASVAVALPAAGRTVPGAEATAAIAAAVSGHVADGARRGVLDRRVADGCRIAMGVTMALMLILMI
jgi:Domain of unknown function (DUF5134)